MKRSNDSGQALVEVAISLSIFLLLAMGTIDFAFLFNHKLTLQNAVRQAGRYAITGNCTTTPAGCNRYNSILTTLENASAGLLTVNNVGSDVTISCINQGGGCPNGAGGPGDVVTIQVTYPYNFITPLISPFLRTGSISR